METTANLEKIGKTLLDLAGPDMTPKQLLKAARKRHPKTSRKEIVRAAFFTVISIAQADPSTAKKLHGFAIEARR